jgi:hypothetical protein
MELGCVCVARRPDGPSLRHPPVSQHDQPGEGVGCGALTAQAIAVPVGGLAIEAMVTSAARQAQSLAGQQYRAGRSRFR